jgi:DNA replication protein DnaC
MLNNATINQLKELRLYAMADAFRKHAEDADSQSLSFEEYVGLMVEAEWLARKNRRITRLITQAAFRFPAAVQDIDYSSREGITKPDIARLSTCSYIKKYWNVLISGPTGVGKTSLACAHGRAACLQGIPARYFRVSDLFDRLEDARSRDTYTQFRSHLASLPLLILDDWGIRQFSLEEAHEIMEIVERRYDKGSTVISGQIPYSAWHDLFPDPTLADSVMDRLVHNAYPYNITGESMRKTIALKSQD